MQQNVPLYQAASEWDPATKYIIGGVIAFPLIIGLVMIPFDMTGAWIMFGLTVFEAIMFRGILPKRFIIYEDRLTMSLGGPFAMHIFFNKITNIRQAESESALVYWGIKFATSTKFIIEVQRRGALPVVFSPVNGEDFLRELQQARDNYREPDFSVFMKNR